MYFYHSVMSWKCQFFYGWCFEIIVWQFINLFFGCCFLLPELLQFFRIHVNRLRNHWKQRNIFLWGCWIFSYKIYLLKNSRSVFKSNRKLDMTVFLKWTDFNNIFFLVQWSFNLIALALGLGTKSNKMTLSLALRLKPSID